MKKRHRHAWVPASPIDPAGDPGDLAAYVASTQQKTTTWACSCGATKMILTTNGFANAYITRPNGDLWLGRRRVGRRSAETTKPPSP